MRIEVSKQTKSKTFHTFRMIIIMISVLLSLPAIGQTEVATKNFIGNWKLETIKNKTGDEVDISLSEEGQKIIFSKIHLKKNSFKVSSWGKRVTGNWQQKGCCIHLTFNDNRSASYNIIKFSKDTLTLQCSEGDYQDLALIYKRRSWF